MHTHTYTHQESCGAHIYISVVPPQLPVAVRYCTVCCYHVFSFPFPFPSMHALILTWVPQTVPWWRYCIQQTVSVEDRCAIPQGFPECVQDNLEAVVSGLRKQHLCHTGPPTRVNAQARNSMLLYLFYFSILHLVCTVTYTPISALLLSRRLALFSLRRVCKLQCWWYCDDCVLTLLCKHPYSSIN